MNGHPLSAVVSCGDTPGGDIVEEYPPVRLVDGGYWERRCPVCTTFRLLSWPHPHGLAGIHYCERDGVQVRVVWPS